MISLIKNLFCVQENLNFRDGTTGKALRIIGEENKKTRCVLESKMEEKGRTAQRTFRNAAAACSTTAVETGQCPRMVVAVGPWVRNEALSAN